MRDKYCRKCGEDYPDCKCENNIVERMFDKTQNDFIEFRLNDYGERLDQTLREYLLKLPEYTYITIILVAGAYQIYHFNRFDFPISMREYSGMRVIFQGKIKKYFRGKVIKNPTEKDLQF